MGRTFEKFKPIWGNKFYIQAPGVHFTTLIDSIKAVCFTGLVIEYFY